MTSLRSALLFAAPALLVSLGACSVEYLPPEADDTDATPADGGGADESGGPAADDGGAGADDGDGESGGDGSLPPPTDACLDQQTAVVQMLEANCGNCHAPGGANSGDLGYINDIEALISNDLIQPGLPTESAVFERVASGQMPPTGIEPRPSETDITLLGDYIRDCTLDAVADCEDQPFISDDDVIAIILDDLSRIEADDQPFTRYFTYANLYNSGLCAEERQVASWGMAKLINALSDQIRVVPPEPVDAEQLVWRINLEDYGWDVPAPGRELEFDDKWEQLVAEVPLSYQRETDEAETVQLLTGTAIPFLSGTEFTANASEPPLYHDLAQIPDTLQELEAKLGIDIQQNVEDEEVLRAGLLDSGVSTQNRLVELHDLGVANQWFFISYDFASNAGEQNIFANPLDFDEDGGEVIYTLPNGFNAYMLVLADGTRIDAGPINIVQNPSDLNNEVVNGVGCFTCHTQMIHLTDEIGPYVASQTFFDQDTKDTVEALHPPAADFAARIDQLTAGIQAAFGAAGVPLDLEVGDPIFASYVAHSRTAGFTLREVAADFGVSSDVFLQSLAALDPAYGPLALPDGRVDRQLINETAADVIRALNRGVPGSELVE